MEYIEENTKEVLIEVKEDVKEDVKEEVQENDGCIVKFFVGLNIAFVVLLIVAIGASIWYIINKE